MQHGDRSATEGGNQVFAKGISDLVLVDKEMHDKNTHRHHGLPHAVELPPSGAGMPLSLCQGCLLEPIIGSAQTPLYHSITVSRQILS